MALLPSLNQFQNNVTNSLVALDNNFSAIATALNTTLAGSGGAADVGSISGTVQGDITSLQSSVTTLQGNIGLGFRNRIINGDMRIDQRNKGLAQTITAAAADAYTVDRFYAYCTGANVTGQQVAGTGSDQYAYQFTGAASVTGISIGQRIEATNCWDLASTTVTISAILSNSLLNVVTWALYYPTSSDTWPTNNTGRTQINTGTFTVTSTPTKYSTQVALPANVVSGMSIEFSVGSQTSGTFTVTEVQIEPGSTLTSFERLPISLSIANCARYCQLVARGANTFISVAAVRSGAATVIGSSIPLGTTMRIAPTISNKSTTYTAGAPTTAGQAAVFNSATGAYATITGAFTDVSTASATNYQPLFSAATSFSVTAGNCVEMYMFNQPLLTAEL
jgi:hypothetical protein